MLPVSHKLYPYHTYRIHFATGKTYSNYLMMWHELATGWVWSTAFSHSGLGTSHVIVHPLFVFTPVLTILDLAKRISNTVQHDTVPHQLRATQYRDRMRSCHPPTSYYLQGAGNRDRHRYFEPLP